MHNPTTYALTIPTHEATTAPSCACANSGGGALTGRSFHLIGVGGAGMSVVAELLRGHGAQVSGSDQADSPILAHLRDCGVRTFVGHEATNVDPESTVVISTAIRPTNPELVVARERGQRVIHRSEALALAAQGLRFVAVAGAHGKTTTSGMMTVALREAGWDPSAAVGSILPGLGTGAVVGTGDVFVAEADESDRSFLNYQPTVELVTNVEPDHLDTYGSTEAFEEIFHSFVDRLVPGGVLVTCAEDPGAMRLAEYARTHKVTTITYGRPEYSAETPDVRIGGVELTPAGATAQFTWGDTHTALSVNVPGIHNVLNAAGAWASGVWLGVAPEVMAQGLTHFTGTARRFELRGTVGDRRVIDDYAHHPTEVEAALRQARLVAGEGHLAVVFQPHLYSRTTHFAQRFAQALSVADTVVVCDIYAAREDPVPGVDSTVITQHLPSAHFVPDMYEAARVAARAVGERGIVVTMGAGSITHTADTVLAEWEHPTASGEEARA